jgi:hypothetical protein
MIWAYTGASVLDKRLHSHRCPPPEKTGARPRCDIAGRADTIAAAIDDGSANVHAQVIRSSDRLIPALRDEPGFAGAMSFFTRQSGDSMIVVLWTTAEQAVRSVAWHGHEPDSIWEVSVRV